MKDINCLLLVLCILIIASCKEQENPSVDNIDHHPLKISRSGRFIIEETFDNKGYLLIKQSFNKDTVPDGAAIDYYTNGKIHRWRWFNADTIPICRIYYNINGRAYAFAGNPFINCVQASCNSIYVTMVNPPNILFTTTLKDFNKNKVIKYSRYDPTLTDSTSWVVFGQHSDQLEPGHRYVLDFYVIDSNYKVLFGAESALEIEQQKYSYITPMKPTPEQIWIKKHVDRKSKCVF